MKRKVRLKNQIHAAIQDARAETDAPPHYRERMQAARKAAMHLGPAWRDALSVTAVEDMRQGRPSKQTVTWWDSLSVEQQEIIEEAALAVSRWEAYVCRRRRQAGVMRQRHGIDERLRLAARHERSTGSRAWERALTRAAAAIERLGDEARFDGRVPSLSLLLNASRARTRRTFRDWFADLDDAVKAVLVDAKGWMLRYQAARRAAAGGTALPPPSTLTCAGTPKRRGPKPTLS